MSSNFRSTKFLQVDKLSLAYLSITGFIFLFYAYEGIQYLQFGVAHGVCLVVIFWLVRQEYLPPPMPVLRYCYPVLLLMLVYFEVQMFSELIYDSNFNYDTIVKQWDVALFGFNPHLHWHKRMPGRFWAELFHLLYLLYYPLLVGSFLWVWKYRVEDYPRFAFVYLGMFLTFIVIFILFPVYGPMDYRGARFDELSYFSRVINILFSIGESNGGAFPSSHVGQSVGIYLLLRPMSLRMKMLLGGVITGIGLSMVYCSIHYAVDAVTGLFTGWILYVAWNYVYNRSVTGKSGVETIR